MGRVGGTAYSGSRCSRVHIENSPCIVPYGNTLGSDVTLVGVVELLMMLMLEVMVLLMVEVESRRCR